MRAEILDYLKSLKLSDYTIANELPFLNSGDAMYKKNAKKIYVDESAYSSEVFIPLLDGTNVMADLESIQVFFSNDSKNTPKDYSSLIYGLNALAEYIKLPQHNTTTTDHQFEHDGDKTITNYTFTFKSIRSNNGN